MLFSFKFENYNRENDLSFSKIQSYIVICHPKVYKMDIKHMYIWLGIRYSGLVLKILEIHIYSKPNAICEI